MSDVESFKALRVMVRFTSSKYDFWLVPEYTGDRTVAEISAEHMNKISMVVGTFEGSKIIDYVDKIVPSMPEPRARRSR